MSSAVADPGSLTKERLKILLKENNVDLPPSDSKKDVLIELYKKHVSEITAVPDFNFSSDEESDIVYGTQKSQKKKKSIRKVQVVQNGNSIHSTDSLQTEANGTPEETQLVNGATELTTELVKKMDVEALNDSALREELMKYGVDAAIVGSTRPLYERKLKKLIDGGGEPEQPEEDEYSDEDDEPEPEPVPEPVQVTRQRQTVTTKQSTVTRRTTRSSGDDVPAAKITKTSTGPVQTSKPAESKSGSSIWLKMFLLLIVAFVVYFLLQHLGGGADNPIPSIN